MLNKPTKSSDDILRDEERYMGQRKSVYVWKIAFRFSNSIHVNIIYLS